MSDLSPDRPAVIVTVPPPPSLNKLWSRAPGGKRVRSRAYRDWTTTAGWHLKMQIVGLEPLVCRFNLTIEVPISRRDTGNWEKALCDLCESVGVVTNDGNAHSITITPTDRADCMLAFWPLPDMGGVRASGFKKKRSGGRKAAPRFGGTVKQAHKYGAWK
jgi:Holliday junction resolvase RusA-like endonuclease